MVPKGKRNRPQRLAESHPPQSSSTERRRNLLRRLSDAIFFTMKEPKDRKEGRTSMQVGDRILVKRAPSKEVLLLARVDIPHSTEKAFATRSGGEFSMGLKVWKSDYVWSVKNQMWVPKN